MSAAPHIALAPARGATVVSLDEWRAARRVPVDEADVPAPAPLRLLRRAVDATAPPRLRLEVCRRRARAVLSDPADERPVDSYCDAEPA